MYIPPGWPGNDARREARVADPTAYAFCPSGTGERSSGSACHRSSGFGRGNGVTPVARLASESTITTVRNASAIRRAVTMTWKHSSIVAGAMTRAARRPVWPNSAASRSDCSTLVGSPVLGPPRCTSMTTSGISVITASPRNSVLSARPGPEVIVNATLPAYDAPIATPTAAISSSA